MKIVFLFYEQMTALDAVGPHEILARLPDAEVKRVALKTGPINTDSGLILQADYSISEVEHADILLIPGGGHATTLSKYPEVHQWIRKLHEKTLWTTSVCTGSLILAAAGILNEVKATTHWAAIDKLKKLGAIPTSERIVEQGKIMTAAGVSAGIDMALTLTAKLCGEQRAQALQLAIEYDPEPPFNCGSPAKAAPALVTALKERMVARFVND